MKNTKAAADPEAPAEPIEAADYELAASLTGFGTYNYLLLLICVVCSLANQFSSSSMSYLLPAAQCDLQMEPSDKGLLNSIMYAGMLSSSFLWGFLSDMLGRRKLIVVAYTADGVLNLIGSFTQSFAFLVVIKFLTGVVLSGPMSIRLTFISEFHSLKYRTRILVISGFLYAVATIIIPAIAWIIIPLPWTVTFFGGYITYNSWRMFVTVGALSSFLAAFLIYLCPEAPKFLMTKGRMEEAMQAFQTMYRYNTGKKPETYPVKKLKDEVPAVPNSLTTDENRKSACSLLRFALKDAKLLLLKPLRNRTIMIMILNYGALLSTNTIRHWVPQMFASAEEYMEHQKYINSTAEYVSTCEMISFTGVSDSSEETNAGSCGVTDATSDEGEPSPVYPLTHHRNRLRLIDSLQDVWTVVDQPPNMLLFIGSLHNAMAKNTVYINNIIVASSQGLSFLLTTYIIKYIGKKTTMVIGYVGSAICCMAAYWTYSTSSALACFALIVSLTGVSNIACLAVIVDMFPTGVRSMATGLYSMTGQLASFTGNLAFPFLLAVDCIAPFSLLTAVTLVCAGVTLLLPDTNKASLQ